MYPYHGAHERAQYFQRSFMTRLLLFGCNNWRSYGERVWAFHSPRFFFNDI
jgi:hypothetical protein